MKRIKYPIEKVIQILSEAELPGSSIAEVRKQVRDVVMYYAKLMHY